MKQNSYIFVNFIFIQKYGVTLHLEVNKNAPEHVI